MQYVYALPGWLITKTVTETYTACIGSSALKTLGCFLNMTLIFVVVHYMDGCFSTLEKREKNKFSKRERWKNMIMNPKIGDYIWFICRWTDLPVLGQVTSLKIDPANKNFPYERPYAEVDWYNGENPSEPGPWCGSTSVLLKDLYKTKQELLDSIKFSTTR